MLCLFVYRKPELRKKGGPKMSNEYVLLVEKEEMWAKMLMQVLRDNEISCTALPVQ